MRLLQQHCNCRLDSSTLLHSGTGKFRQPSFFTFRHFLQEVFVNFLADICGNNYHLTKSAFPCKYNVSLVIDNNYLCHSFCGYLTSRTQLILLLCLHVQVFAASIRGHSQRGRAPGGPAVILEQPHRTHRPCYQRLI